MRDRLNELVFIGQDMDKQGIIMGLEQCLLQDNEQDLFNKQIRLNDPFPKDI
ncbi:MAG: GTP-binding protein [Chitinophagaceae bacterium]|nr:GTP-binding protein [Chitinophagaceae bacterium]